LTGGSDGGILSEGIHKQLAMTFAAEKIIAQAIEDGLFDNLPGQGRPLPIEHNPHSDPSLAAAYRLLQNHGFSLPWIEAGKRIAADLEVARTRLRQRRGWILRRGVPLSGSIGWRETVADFRTSVAELNRRIIQLNLTVPLPRFQRRWIDAEAELAELA